MKSKQEFIQAGATLHDALNDGLEGVDEQGRPVVYVFGYDETIDVKPATAPPYGTEIGVRRFLQSLSVGIAVAQNVKVDPLMDAEVDVMVGTVLLPLRSAAASWKMSQAIERTAAARRKNVDHFGAHFQSCVEAVIAEERVRDTLSLIDTQYTRYERAAEGDGGASMVAEREYFAARTEDR